MPWIKQRLASYTLTPQAARFIQEASLFRSSAEAEQWRAWLARHEQYVRTYHTDEDLYLALAAVGDAQYGVLLADELAHLQSACRAAMDVRQADEFWKYCDCEEMEPVRQVCAYLDAMIVDGQVVPPPGSVLAQLRVTRDGLDKEIRTHVHRLLRKAPWQELALESNPVLFDGQSCLMLSQAPKTGTVLGRSRGGNAWYVQPDSLQELSTKLHRTRQQITVEEIKLLETINEQIASLGIDWTQVRNVLLQVERLYAELQFVSTMQEWFARPLEHIEGHSSMQMHAPAVFDARKQDSVALPASKQWNQPTLVTGPNAGGKSVYLSLWSALHFLIKRGLIPWPEEIWPGALWFDAGDHQSVGSGESSYSAHVGFLAQALAQAGPQDWIIVDELGDKTDPDEGGWIGAIWMQRISAVTPWVWVSTHNRWIKEVASEANWHLVGFGLGDQLQPDYRVREGIIASSYALEAATRAGFKQDFLDAVSQQLDDRLAVFRDLQALEEHRHHLRQQVEAESNALTRLRDQKAAAESETIAQYSKRFDEAYQQILAEASEKLAQELDTKKAIRKAAQRDQTRQFRAQAIQRSLDRLQSDSRSISEAKAQADPNVDALPKLNWTPEVGMNVQHRVRKQKGVIVSVGDVLRVEYKNGWTVPEPYDDLVPVSADLSGGKTVVVQSGDSPEGLPECIELDEKNAQVVLHVTGVIDEIAVDGAVRAYELVKTRRQFRQVDVRGRRKERLEPMLDAIEELYDERPVLRRSVEGRSWLLLQP